jgi:hypothetical protein
MVYDNYEQETEKRRERLKMYGNRSGFRNLIVKCNVVIYLIDYSH